MMLTRRNRFESAWKVGKWQKIHSSKNGLSWLYWQNNVSFYHFTQIRCIPIQILIIQRFSDIELGLPVAQTAICDWTQKTTTKITKGIFKLGLPLGSPSNYFTFKYLLLFLAFLFYQSHYYFLVLFQCRYLGAFSQYLISPFTIVYKHMLILLLTLNLKMTVGRSKRRSFLMLTFIVKSILKIYAK